MSDPQSPPRWSCIVPRYEGPFGFRKVTRLVEVAGGLWLPMLRVNKLLSSAWYILSTTLYSTLTLGERLVA